MIMAATEKGLSDGEVDQLRSLLDERGYCSVAGLLTPAECQSEIEGVFDRLTFGPLTDETLRASLGRDYGDQSQGTDTKVEDFQLINVNTPSKHEPQFQNNIFERRCLELARRLRPEHVMVKDYEQFLTKVEGKADAVFPWHQDSQYWPRKFPAGVSTVTLTFSLALTDADEEHGCLRVVPGSHRRASYEPTVLPEGDARAVRMADPDPSDVVYLPVKRGDVTIHDEWIVHGSGGNRAPVPRKTVVLAFRDEKMVAYERDIGFSHSYNDDPKVLQKIRAGEL